ncbi:MAG: hypothetical protein KKB03_00250 [Nanoarchaeota archaeon]|nr:hypothetical protein [Nanoarchaeota archaeon]MBU1135839.1 hypothetical protein [Nanoarchaeota archaeon]MBU2519659.1 hypothetical protein [Nanoarchaeota archaeon]
MNKGQVYSLITILIAMPLLLFFIFYFNFTQTTTFGSYEKIIADQIHDVAKDMENDFERAIKISGKRALLASTNDVVIDGIPLTDSISIIEELMLNGSIEGNAHILMHNNTLGDWQESILNIPVGFNIELDYNNMQIQNYDGFNFKVTLNLTIHVSDKHSIAKIDRNMQKEVLVSVENIEDVIFPLNTAGFISRVITRYPYPYYTKKIVIGTQSSGQCSGNVTFNPSDPSPSGKILVTTDSAGVSGFAGVVSENIEIPSVSCYVLGATGAVNEINETVLELGFDEIFLDESTLSAWSLPIKTALSNKYYFHFEGQSGPDILDRLEEDLTQVTNGLETFVNIPEISSAGVGIKSQQTCVAYKYFSSQTNNGDPVRGLPSWFKIDSESAAKYGLDQLTN